MRGSIGAARATHRTDGLTHGSVTPSRGRYTALWKAHQPGVGAKIAAPAIFTGTSIAPIATLLPTLYHFAIRSIANFTAQLLIEDSYQLAKMLLPDMIISTQGGDFRYSRLTALHR